MNCTRDLILPLRKNLVDYLEMGIRDLAHANISFGYKAFKIKKWKKIKTFVSKQSLTYDHFFLLNRVPGSMRLQHRISFLRIGYYW